MEEKILEILKDNKEWNSSLEYTAKELLDLFSVSDSETITISKKEYDWLKKCEKDLGGIDFSL